MSICVQEEALFKRWAKQYPRGFVRDGVVSEKDYLRSELKILFVLKEANGEANGDIRKLIRTGRQDFTWDNVARWAYGIRNRSDLPAWKEFPKLNDQFRKQEMQHIVAMNLKKSPGGSKANKSAIKKAVVRDAEMIEQQFNLYSPELILCCGRQVADLLLGALKIKDTDSKWKITYEGIRHCKISKSQQLVEFVHPAHRAKPELMLYPLMRAINQIYRA